MSNPAHHITVEPADKRVTVRFAGREIAASDRALALREGGMAPVHYLPREDVDMSLLERTTNSSHCPFKGDAAYYSVTVDGRTAENAVWTYESPLPAVAGIEGRLAFWQGRVDAIEETPLKAG